MQQKSLMKVIDRGPEDREFHQKLNFKSSTSGGIFIDEDTYFSFDDGATEKIVQTCDEIPPPPKRQYLLVNVPDK